MRKQGLKYDKFESDVEDTMIIIKNLMTLMLAQKDDMVIRKIAEEIRLLYPSYNNEVAVSRYYDEVVMGGRYDW